MNLNEKVEFLNGLVDKTLTLTHYTKWELGSYREGSLFCQQGLIGHVHAHGFAECIDRALRLVRKGIANV